MTRTRRFLGGLSLGYVYLGLVTVVGLWLTPFLLGRIGQQDYGLWLITTQLMGYLMLLDLGVVALAPRETAFATGRALSGAHGEVARTLATFRRIVRWQVVPTALVSALAWWLVSRTWPELFWPLAWVMAAFVVAFPVRLYNATLQGLQDLPFLGKVQLGAWAIGTATTIALVLAGAGLMALAGGWILTQAASAIACRLRLEWRHREVWHPATQPVSWREGRSLLERSGWLSLAQAGHVFLNGSDVLVLGAVLGPAATVPYACTGKLVTVLANHPQLLMQTAAPALAEIRTSAPRQHLVTLALALTRAMLVMSGGIACLVLTANQTFVTWWVGSEQFAGWVLTALLIAVLLVRHLNATMTYALYSFGYERRLSLTALADGGVTVVTTAALALSTSMGVVSAAYGALAGVLLVSLPLTTRALLRELGISLADLVCSLRGWAARWLVASAICVAVARLTDLTGLAGLLAYGLLVVVVYGGIMLPLALEPPLGHYVRGGLGVLGLSWPVRRQTQASQSHP
jgi:O-antigen/teichoic acid export membrane protein